MPYFPLSLLVAGIFVGTGGDGQCEKRTAEKHRASGSSADCICDVQCGQAHGPHEALGFRSTSRQSYLNGENVSHHRCTDTEQSDHEKKDIGAKCGHDGEGDNCTSKSDGDATSRVGTAALAVLGGDDAEDGEIVGAIGNLVDKSLLVLQPGVGPAQLRLSGMTRTYAAIKLAECGEHSLMHQRLVALELLPEVKCRPDRPLVFANQTVADS